MDTWNDILARISRSEFKIRQIDRDSGLLKIRFSSPPDRYLDCGTRSISIDDRKTRIENAAPHYKY